MKITFISEDDPNGREVDWPVVPGTGDWISTRYAGGTVRQEVSRVEYEASESGELVGVTVHLEQ